MHNAVYTAAAVLLSCGLLSAASAQEAKQVVSYHDLDLSTAKGQQSLTQRLNRASQEVCGSAEVRDLDAMRDRQHCRRVAMNNAGKTATALAARKTASGQAYSSLSEDALPRVPAK